MKRHRFVEPAVARRIDEERSADARRPAGELNNDDVSSNVSNQQEATAQTSSWYWKDGHRVAHTASKFTAINSHIKVLQQFRQIP
ncbi:hypothetical protein F511_20678 [Dorcoceras hygrometricum]|uniref:Uncharacterized protein n=1 Tax=Dorcoceras hygrometricum TaxID=472368 RepID=A0A2Z7BEN9_9LAMI|nr:hypothetical protein F511_20678 [Dorcoceras hygrometricum]